jgi:hypothetical protein
MKVWYLSEQRFTNRIVKRWQKKGFAFNAGHLNILRYSYRVVLYWSNMERQKVSEANIIDINPKLF